MYLRRLGLVLLVFLVALLGPLSGRARAAGGGSIFLPLVSRPNQPPSIAASPNPGNAALALSVLYFAWQGGDPDGDPVTYTVYLDTLNPPVKMLASNLADAFLDMLSQQALLSPDTTYYWRVEARDIHGAVSLGPVWSFLYSPPNCKCGS